MARNTRTRSVRRRGGQNLVEFALVLPILMILFGCVADLGFLFWKDNAFAAACREGAVYGVMQSPSAGSFTSTMEARTRLFILGLTEGTGLLASEVAITPTSDDTAINPEGKCDSLVITITHNHQFFTPFNPLRSDTFTMVREWRTGFVQNLEGTER